MESKVTLEPALVSILNGVDLSKLIPLFEKYSISLDMFFFFTDDDLLQIGVENSSDRELILNIKNKLQKSYQVDEDLCARSKEILEVIKNSQNHIHAIDVATCYVSSTLKNEKVDFIVEGNQPISSVISMLCNRAEKENSDLISEIDEMLKKLKMNQKSTEQVITKNMLYGFTCSTFVILVSIFAFFRYKKNCNNF